MDNVFKTERTTLYLLTILLIIVGATQAYNMFSFPYYHNDEGTYLADSWTLATAGHLSPYSYSYDIPPAGTALIAAWTRATGGVSTFGFALNSGRIFMLFMHVLTTGLLYLTAYKLAKSHLTAWIVALVFALSPLTTSVQRLIMPENIMIMWLLLSVYLVMGENRTLRHYIGSAFAFGLAVTTQGGAIFFLPALLYIIITSAHNHHKRFAVSLWITFALLFISFYPMYAQMKEELFPEGWVLSGDFPHVSLITRIADRGPETGRFLNYGSGLGDALSEWLDLAKPATDPVLVYGGLIAGLFIFLLSIDHRELRPILALLLAGMVKLIFGVPVYKIDAVYILPWLALAIGLLATRLYRAVDNTLQPSKWKPVLVVCSLGLVLYPFWSFDATRIDVYTQDQVQGQIAAVDWMRNYLPENATIVTDNFAFVALRETHPNVHSYWRVDTDPAVKFTLLKDDRCNINYVVTTTQILNDTEHFHLDLMNRAITESDVIVTYENNGWPIEIRQVRNTYCVTDTASQNRTLLNKDF
jgi:4-amino-4-deoxy-L-arabinose transferase-like glycosyltransferase